ncbi:MAG: hypothetical protein UX60_C0020G0001, partial [Berkelbacteria bacterium GW2011_GWA2_46_7]
AAAAADGGGPPEPQSLLVSFVHKLYESFELVIDRPRPVLATE